MRERRVRRVEEATIEAEIDVVVFGEVLGEELEREQVRIVRVEMRLVLNSIGRQVEKTRDHVVEATRRVSVQVQLVVILNYMLAQRPFFFNNAANGTEKEALVIGVSMNPHMLGVVAHDTLEILVNNESLAFGAF